MPAPTHWQFHEAEMMQGRNSFTGRDAVMTERIRGRRGMRQRAWIKREQPLCAACAKVGRIAATQEIDHIIPLSRGGTNDRSNMIGLCRECHERKTAKDMGYRPRHRTGVDGWPVDEQS
jgi:5-methylcytosine-specific restriction protein A